MDGAIYTETCGLLFNKLFKTLCIPKCPVGYLDNGQDCEKRDVQHLGNYFSFDFRDLFN